MPLLDLNESDIGTNLPKVPSGRDGRGTSDSCGARCPTVDNFWIGQVVAGPCASLRPQ